MRKQKIWTDSKKFDIILDVMSMGDGFIGSWIWHLVVLRIYIPEVMSNSGRASDSDQHSSLYAPL